MAPMQSTSPPLSHSDLTSPSPASPQTLAPSPITGDDSGDEWELLTSDPKHEHSSNDAVDVDPNINDTSASIHEAGVTAVQSPLSASAPGLPNACPCGTESDDLRTLRRKVRLATPVDDIILCVGEDEKKDHDGLLGYGKPLDSDGGSSLPKHLGEFEEDRRQTYTFPALKSNPIFDILQPLHDESERTETKSDKPVRSIMKLRLLELQKQKMLFMAKQAENRVNSVDVASLKRGIDSSQELKQAMETLGSRISLLEEKLLRLESEVDTVAQKSEERQRIPHRVPNHEATRKADEQFVTEVIGVPLTFSWSKRRETQETIPTVVEPEREAVEPDAAEQSIRTCAKVPDSADEDLQARYGKTYDRMHAIFEQQREALRARQCQLTARLSPSAHSSEDLEARRLKQYNESVAVFQKEQADLRELKRQQNVYMAQMRVLREKKEKEQATTSTMPSVQDYAETWLKKSRYGEGLTAERAQPITSMSELESFEKRNTSQQDKSIKHPLLHDTTYREHPGNVRETILRSVLFSDAMTALFENQLFRSFRSHPDRRADIARMVAETIIVRGEGYVLVKMEDMEKYKAKLMQIADAWPVDSTRSSWKALEERV